MPSKHADNSSAASLRERILEAARDLFLAKGFEGVSVRRIAERAGCSPGMLYHFYANKELLLARVVEDTFVKLDALMMRAAARGEDPLDRLRNTLGAYLEFGLQHPHEYLFLFVHGHSHLAPDVQSVFETRGGACYNRLRAVCAQCAEAGLLRDGMGNPDETAQALWASIHGLIHLLHSAEGFPFASRRRLVRRQIEMLMAGIRKT